MKPGPKPITTMVTEEWHERYIDLLAEPTDKRTNKQFIETEKLCEQTFYKWLKRFRQDVYEEANRRLRTRRNQLRTKAWKRLEDQFADKSGGNVIKALELYFKLNGDLVERTENRTEMITPEQKKVRLAQFLQEIKAKSSKSNEESAQEGDSGEGDGKGQPNEASGGQGTEPGNDNAGGGV